MPVNIPIIYKPAITHPAWCGKKAAAKKAGEPTTEVNVQFDGKTYTTETLIQSAKDVWKYDLKKNPDDLQLIRTFTHDQPLHCFNTFFRFIKSS